MSANCNTYDERNKVGDAIGAGFTSADKGYKSFLEKFGASDLAKSRANPVANLFGHVSLMIAAGQVVQKYRQGNKEQAFIEFTSIAAVYLVAQIFLYSV